MTAALSSARSHSRAGAGRCGFNIHPCCGPLPPTKQPGRQQAERILNKLNGSSRCHLSMMLDDDLYSAVAGIPPSPLAPTPSQSGIDSDGYRITWGPSTCSILADFRARHPSSALATSSSSLASGLTSHAALNCVKRSSLNAGLGSPTRPGGASTPTGFEPTHHNRSVSSAAGASSSTISQGSRFSKRRRRIPTSVSWHGASSSSSHNISGWQDKSASTANASEDTMSMLDELAKRLEARQAQPGSPLAPRRTSAAAPQANKENRHLRADLKGKGKMCSPIVELEEQPTNGSIKTMSAKPIASNAVPEPRTPARPALAPKEDNIVKQSSQSRVYVKGSLPAEIVTIEQRGKVYSSRIIGSGLHLHLARVADPSWHAPCPLEQ